jgi:hypothetical protein
MRMKQSDSSFSPQAPNVLFASLLANSSGITQVGGFTSIYEF